MKKNLELILLIINWVIVAIQAFTIFLYGNSIGLFIIMLLALIAQVFSVYDNRKNNMIKWSKGIIDACLHAIRDVYLSDPHYTEKVAICCRDAGN